MAGLLLLATWATFFSLFVAALVWVIQEPRRGRSRVTFAVAALAGLLLCELWLLSGVNWLPDIAEPAYTISPSA